MLKKQSLILALVFSIGITGVSVALMQDNSVQTQELSYLGKYSEYLSDKKVPRSFTLDSMYGTPSPNIEALNVRSDSNIKESTSLPTGLEVKALLTKGTAEQKARLTTVIYGPISIDYDKLETFSDVMNSHGVIVLYNEERDDFNIEKWYKDVLRERPNTQSVEVNNVPAIGVNGDPEQGKVSKLIFHDDRTQVQLVSVGYTLSDLIKIASTL